MADRSVDPALRPREAVELLISAEDLARVSGGPALLDVRWELGGGARVEEYLRGHIPRAVFVDLDSVLAAPPGERGRHPLPDADVFEAGMRAAGVSNDRAVVVYDAASSIPAARAWWLLRYFGHGDVSVLDGGLAAWVAAGFPVDSGEVWVAPGDFVARPGQMAVVGALEAAALASGGGSVLLDARAPERFRGEQEPIDPVAGHIPGARNVPASEIVDASGRFLGRHALRARLEAAGVRDGVAAGAYCGSGVTGAHTVLALELAGYRAALYPGSWSEWITDPTRRVATGD